MIELALCNSYLSMSIGFKFNSLPFLDCSIRLNLFFEGVHGLVSTFENHKDLYF